MAGSYWVRYKLMRASKPYKHYDVPLNMEFVVLWLSGSFKGVVALALIFEYESGPECVM